jgi:glucose-1-phosphate adenylyltransferase
MNTLKSLSSKQKQTSSFSPRENINMNRVAAIILGGGQGTRLHPLTLTQCKPAMTFGGRYRIIDIPLSNSINSGCKKNYIITQFLSSSLHRHISNTYYTRNFPSGFIELLCAEEKPASHSWFQGTADAVRKNIDYIIDTPVDYFLILSGDQLYNMNFENLLQTAYQTNADAIIAALPIDEKKASRMGVIQFDENLMITNFLEKPQEKALLEKMHISEEIQQKTEIHLSPDTPYIGSMGIYLFKRDVLIKLLEYDRREDFGKHLIPTLVKQGKVAIYLHRGYWEDIGTIESFYQANMALTLPNPGLNWYDENNPIISYNTNLPGAKLLNTYVNQSIICEGSFVEANEISNSILGPRSVVKKGSIIRNSYIMGNDFYCPPIDTGRLPKDLQIGENCFIRNAIIDKHVCIGNHVQLINKNNLMFYNSDNVYIRDGIIVVTSGTHIPEGYIL